MGRRHVMSPVEAGRLLGLSRSAAYRAIERGDLPSIRIGRRIVVPVAPIAHMLGLDADELVGEGASDAAA